VIIPLQETINFEPTIRNPTLYDFAAAGTFSEIQSERDFTLI
jgi:hypothetical protein